MSSNSHPSAAVNAFHRCIRTIIEETKSLDAADKTRTLLVYKPTSAKLSKRSKSP